LIEENCYEHIPGYNELMPEFPDLVYIEKRLNSDLAGRKIERVEVKQPIVMRSYLPPVSTRKPSAPNCPEVILSGYTTPSKR